MKRRVVVTGLGVVTSLSCHVDDLFDRVVAGESGIHELRIFDTTKFKVNFAGFPPNLQSGLLGNVPCVYGHSRGYVSLSVIGRRVESMPV